jgi:hypothetical protein
MALLARAGQDVKVCAKVKSAKSNTPGIPRFADFEVRRRYIPVSEFAVADLHGIAGFIRCYSGVIDVDPITGPEPDPVCNVLSRAIRSSSIHSMNSTWKRSVRGSSHSLIKSKTGVVLFTLSCVESHKLY